MHYANGLRSDWRLMSVQCVRDNVAIIDNGSDRCDFLAIDNDLAAFNSVFLDRINIRTSFSQVAIRT